MTEGERKSVYRKKGRRVSLLPAGEGASLGEGNLNLTRFGPKAEGRGRFLKKKGRGRSGGCPKKLFRAGSKWSLDVA